MQMYVLPTNSVRPIAGTGEKAGKIAHFEFRKSGEKLDIQAGEMIFIRETVPSNNLWGNLTEGSSRFDAAWDAILADNALQAYFKEELEGGLLPPVFILSLIHISEPTRPY